MAPHSDAPGEPGSARTSTAPAYPGLSRADLAILVPELLLSGQMIDRSGMAHLIGAFGRDTMTRIAIEEWMAASPVYTSRMRAALGIDGDGVADMFKCLQLDIGAPPQFMDFRYEVTDHDHGAFVLNHCGALMDVEPLGDEYVTAMCHDIEDPTFDATAIATNRRARIRPIHRPPRRPADRHPHCAWTVTIDPAREELPLPAGAELMFGTRAAQATLSPIDPDAADGHSDYRGPLVADLDFAEWSRSALIRIAEEVALQHHLLALGFRLGLARRAQDGAQRDGIFRKQLIGIAGLTAGRLRRALGVASDADGLARVLAVHPVLGPVQYTGVTVEASPDAVRVRIPATSDAMRDDGWLALLDVDHTEPLQAIATAVDPRWSVSDVRDYGAGLQVWVTHADTPLTESDEVAIARVSSGSTFDFEPRRPIPITPTGTGTGT
ncbi:hypothetical protein GCM10009624_02240 [Gordonia sinesedis]